MVRSSSVSRAVSQSPIAQLPRGRLDHDAHDVADTGRGRPVDQQRVGEAGDGRLQPRLVAHPAVLGGIVGDIEVAHGRRHDQPPPQAQRAVIAVEAPEAGQSGEGEVDLGGDPRLAQVARLPAEPGPQHLRIDQVEQRPSRVEPADHDRGVELLARGEPDARGVPVGGTDGHDLGTRCGSRRPPGAQLMRAPRRAHPGRPGRTPSRPPRRRRCRPSRRASPGSCRPNAAPSTSSGCPGPRASRAARRSRSGPPGSPRWTAAAPAAARGHGSRRVPGSAAPGARPRGCHPGRHRKGRAA